MRSPCRLVAGPALTAVFAGALGCRLPPPIVALRPTGVGWACTHARQLETWSLCERVAADCEATAAQVRADARSEGAPADIPPCHAQPRALCYTFHSVAAANDNFMCYETATDCEAGQRRLLSEPSSYTNVSRCDEWE